MRYVTTAMLAEGAYYLSHGLELRSVFGAFLEMADGFEPFCQMSFTGEGVQELSRRWRTAPYPSVSDEEVRRLCLALGSWAGGES